MISLLLGAALLLTNGQSINFFSLKQDVEIGSEAAREADKLPLVRSDSVTRYVTIIGQRVSQNRSLPALRYRFKVVNSKDINSLGFPGGSIYIYRGLLDIASNDDEVAAILAHEVSHVASRHGTSQLSRLLLVQAPIAIAAGLSAADIWKDEVAKLGISLGIEAPFLRYSRDQELDAGLMAVKLMSDARFDPNAFRTVLEKVNEAQTALVFNHPQTKTLAPELASEIDQLMKIPRRVRASASPDFREFRSALQRVAYIPARMPAANAIDAPLEAGTLSKVFTHPMDYYRLSYPASWQVTRTPPNGAIVAPADGIAPARNGGDITHGVMFDLFDISLADRTLPLEQATNRLIAFLVQTNKSLRTIPGGETQTLVSDEPGLRTVMIGKPGPNGQPEVAWVVTRLYYQSLFYMVLVAPEDEFPAYQPIFEQMIRSVRLR